MAKRIAIVEDDPDQRANYTDAITNKGYDVTGYASRQEALEGFDRDLPDLAILDIILGEDDGDPRPPRRKVHDLPRHALLGRLNRGRVVLLDPTGVDVLLVVHVPPLGRDSPVWEKLLDPRER